MADVFISYKSERRNAAAHLAKILERYGYSVWFDYGLVKGWDFAAQIDANIREAKAVIVLWCGLSVRSEWVANEAALAAKLGTLIPAKIEPCDLRLDFDRIDYIELIGWSGAPRDHLLDVLLDAMEQKIGRPPQLDFKAMREYEEDWRRFGAPSLKTFALDASAGRSQKRSRSSTTPAERDWERFAIAETQDLEIIAAFVEQYAKREPLWATRAGQRLSALNAFRTEEIERKREEAARAKAARYKAEGRVELTSSFITNTHGRWFLPGAGKTEWFRDLEDGPDMVVVPSGKFMMGSPAEEPQRESWKAGTESPQHEVAIPNAFAIGRCAVTRGQFRSFVVASNHTMSGDVRIWSGKEWKIAPSCSWRNPGFTSDDSHPVVCVSWVDAQAYVKWLSDASGSHYRLPSEAEWEYACRAGTTTPFWWSASISPDLANYDGSTVYEGGGRIGPNLGRTVPAKHFEPNSWGLYQVHGNVWEWCEDLWHRSYVDKPDSLRASGGTWATEISGFRVLRGGSWNNNPRSLRAANRIKYGLDARYSNVGFRVARSVMA
jgi:formylglycine-generating enzyme required for sulfatase activity